MNQTIVRYKYNQQSEIPITRQLPDFLDLLIKEGHTILNVIPTHLEKISDGYYVYAATIITSINNN